MAHKKEAAARATAAIRSRSGSASRPTAARSITAGSIIVRQRGTKIHAGTNVGMGTDHTLFALIDGQVSFATKGKDKKKVASVLPVAA